MATIRQIEANRLNALQSTGPRSVEGKSRSSMNALKSGIHARAEIIYGEDPGALEALASEYLARFRPATPEQRHYVDTLVRADWQLRRLAVVEARLWEHGMKASIPRARDLGGSLAGSAQVFAMLQRRIDSTQRLYDRALREIQRLQSAPTDPDPEPLPQDARPQLAENPDPPAQIGFVPSLRCEAAPSLEPEPASPQRAAPALDTPE